MRSSTDIELMVMMDKCECETCVFIKKLYARGDELVIRTYHDDGVKEVSGGSQ